MPQVFVKDPGATTYFTIDWTSWLGSDTIESSTWTVPDGITEESDDNDTTSATIWLSGGTHQQDYIIINTITTAAGQIEPRRIRVEVRER